MIISEKPCEKFMKALEKAHLASVHYRKSLNHDGSEDILLKEAFDFSFRLSELLRDVGNIRMQEII